MDVSPGDTSQESPPTSAHGLTYEETPVIEPIVEAPQQEIQPPSASHSFGSTIGMIILFIILFGAGVGLSVFLRQYLEGKSAPPAGGQTSLPKSTPPAGLQTPTSAALLTPTSLPDPYAGWKQYQVISGTTKVAISGISFKLPAEVLAPICDGGSCISQGTYLPNGSRFTVAARGKGQSLTDARGNIIVTDVSGKSFTTKPVTLLGGRKALEYSGLFSGTTVGGYTFSQMRGLMIEIDDTMTLEMNHFTPSGVNADFAADDIVFDKVVQSLAVSRFATLTPSLSPTRAATASPTP